MTRSKTSSSQCARRPPLMTPSGRSLTRSAYDRSVLSDEWLEPAPCPRPVSPWLRARSSRDALRLGSHPTGGDGGRGGVGASVHPLPVRDEADRGAECEPDDVGRDVVGERCV